MSMTVKRKFRVETGKTGRKKVCRGGAKPETSTESVPRISRLMALAIRFDEMIRRGEVKDQAELARLGHVSRARLSQVMNLLNLAPEIQEELLFLSPMCFTTEPVERRLRLATTFHSWCDQRQHWSQIDHVGPPKNAP